MIVIQEGMYLRHEQGLGFCSRGFVCAAFALLSSCNPNNQQTTLNEALLIYPNIISKNHNNLWLAEVRSLVTPTFCF